VPGCVGWAGWAACAIPQRSFGAPPRSLPSLPSPSGAPASPSPSTTTPDHLTAEETDYVAGVLERALGEMQ